MNTWIRKVVVIAIGLQIGSAEAAEKYEGEYFCKSNIIAGAERVGGMDEQFWKPVSGVNQNTQFILYMTPTDDRTAYWVQMKQMGQDETVPCKSTVADTYEIKVNKFGDVVCTANDTQFQASLMKLRFAWVDVYEHLAFDFAKSTSITIGDCAKLK
ncbi:hypothetical protein NKY66_10675 [Sinorhizobium meliloti]|uniref:hypothetical protein n=1 Tax=Rhizobium meliloti TaxID=382 RepID=UPI003D65A0A0